eukprot:CAMPEP_0171134182 /NCGR_PEP_ID=MMETSP0766_2-20121228/127550_1 /TAXON_ID=439317 /ORGANISM="Gambierdiscus australes, Strain CAWD 149" /LENGTH=269 /DNA_ID=CAMNT_0011597611 /DNA_START=219 /DNA_END=1028 /DNA_ORIENTATION=+
MCVDSAPRLTKLVPAASCPLATTGGHIAQHCIAVHKPHGEGKPRKLLCLNTLRGVWHVHVPNDHITLLEGERLRSCGMAFAPVPRGAVTPRVDGVTPSAVERFGPRILGRPDETTTSLVLAVSRRVAINDPNAATLTIRINVMQWKPDGNSRSPCGETVENTTRRSRCVWVEDIREELRIPVVVLRTKEGLALHANTVSPHEGVHDGPQRAVQQEVSERVRLPADLLDLAHAPPLELSLAEVLGLFVQDVEHPWVDSLSNASSSSWLTL